MPLSNFGLVDDSYPGALYRSAQPDKSGLEWLNRKLGVELVYKLNEDNPEEKGWVEDVTVVNAVRSLEDWVEPEKLVEEAERLRTLLISGQGAVLVHCLHGRDRTGLLVGVYRLLYCGWTFEQIDKEMQEYGMVGIYAVEDSFILGVLKRVQSLQNSRSGLAGDVGK